MIEARQKFQAIAGQGNRADLAIRQDDPRGGAGARQPAQPRRAGDRAQTGTAANREACRSNSLSSGAGRTLAAEQAKREKDVGPRLDAVGRKIAEVQQKVQAAVSGKADDSEILGPLAEARRDLTDLGPELPYVGDNLQSLATVLAQKIDATT